MKFAPKLQTVAMHQKRPKVRTKISRYAHDTAAAW
jgi:hypothetical protein